MLWDNWLDNLIASLQKNDPSSLIQAFVMDEGHYLSKAGGLSTYTAIPTNVTYDALF